MSELKKRPSVTEDLHISTVSSASTPSVVNKSLGGIKENEESRMSSPMSPTAAIIPQPGKASTINSISTSTKKEEKRTLGEMTQDIKAQLSKASDEIEQADAEFQRLLANLEKKVAALRINLSNSK